MFIRRPLPAEAGTETFVFDGAFARGRRVGVYNEWRMRHDEQYADKQRAAYHRTKENKLAAETEEERAIREDRALREKQYREEVKAEKARRRERERERRLEETARQRDAEKARRGVEVDVGNGNTMIVSQARYKQLERA